MPKVTFSPALRQGTTQGTQDDAIIDIEVNVFDDEETKYIVDLAAADQEIHVVFANDSKQHVRVYKVLNVQPKSPENYRFVITAELQHVSVLIESVHLKTKIMC